MSKTDLLQTTAVFDPVALRIGNMVHVDTSIDGATVTSDQGWMVRGTFRGQMTIRNGTLWLDEGGVLAGQIEVHGDAYVFGQVGTEEGDQTTRLICHGQLHLAASSTAFGALKYKELVTYSGARVCSKIESL
jgi:cytoskeletal protein CcmA (bactofilin family)